MGRTWGSLVTRWIFLANHTKNPLRSKNDLVHINVTAGKHYWRQWKISSWKDLVPVFSGKQVENTAFPQNVLLPKHPGRGYKTWWTFSRGNTFVKKHSFVLMILLKTNSSVRWEGGLERQISSWYLIFFLPKYNCAQCSQLAFLLQERRRPSHCNMLPEPELS